MGAKGKLEQPVALAPRYSEGAYLGHYPATVVRRIRSYQDGHRAFLVRFEDGHEAGAFRRELRATAAVCARIDALTYDVVDEGGES